MLWYKSWLETRSRFLIGLVLLTGSAGAVVFAYPQVMRLLPMASTVDAGGELGRRIREGVELARDYRGYVWSQWFRQNLMQLGTLFAVLLGSGGLLSRGPADAALFTLSLPVSRSRLLGIRAAAGLSEWLALAIVPSLAIPLFSPAVGKTYGIGDALVHGVCAFVAGSAFFSLAFFLSAMFVDLWRPLLIACGAAVALALCEPLFPELAPYSIFRVMNAETYFRTGSLPWVGLLASAALSSVLIFGAMRAIEQRDF
jgi:hypothetical protein